MTPIFTKSSAEAKITDIDNEIFKKVVEKRFNEHTGLNKLFENDFRLQDGQYEQYQPYKFDAINELEEKFFVKACLTDRFKMNYKELKNKTLLCAYVDNKLVLEISMTMKQLDAILDKYEVNLSTDEPKLITATKYLFYAGTFMRNEKGILTSKLTNLNLIKMSYK